MGVRRLRENSSAGAIEPEVKMILRVDRGMGADDVEEELVDAQVVAEFGVEGGGQDVVLADENREAVAGGEDFDPGAGAGDAGGADEYHLKGAAGEFGWGGEDSGVDLTSVGVAFDRDVEGAEGDLRG